MFLAPPRAGLVLPAGGISPAAALEWAQRTSCQDHAAELLDAALLVITELVTNAVRHGGPPILLAIECDDASLRVRVRDGSLSLPSSRDAGMEAETGRGMTLVELLTSTWGVAPVADDYGLGKEVWFELRR